MKVARFVLKIVAASLAAAALTCCVVAYWDKIMNFFRSLTGKVKAAGCPCSYPSEYDDYADWDME